MACAFPRATASPKLEMDEWSSMQTRHRCEIKSFTAKLSPGVIFSGSGSNVFINCGARWHAKKNTYAAVAITQRISSEVIRTAADRKRPAAQPPTRCWISCVTVSYFAQVIISVIWNNVCYKHLQIYENLRNIRLLTFQRRTFKPFARILHV